MARINSMLDASLSGDNVERVPDGNAQGGIPVLFRMLIADVTGDTDLVMKYKVRVIDCWVVKEANAGASGDIVTLKNGATAISDVIDIEVADKIIVRAGTLDDAQVEIDAGDDMTVSAVSVTDCQCTVYVLALRVA